MEFIEETQPQNQRNENFFLDFIELTCHEDMVSALFLLLADNIWDVLKYKRRNYNSVLKRNEKIGKNVLFFMKIHTFCLKKPIVQLNLRKICIGSTFFILRGVVVIFVTNPLVLRKNRCFPRVIMKDFQLFNFFIIL